VLGILQDGNKKGVWTEIDRMVDKNIEK